MYDFSMIHVAHIIVMIIRQLYTCFNRCSITEERKRINSIHMTVTNTMSYLIQMNWNERLHRSHDTSHGLDNIFNKLFKLIANYYCKRNSYPCEKNLVKSTHTHLKNHIDI